MSHKESIIQAGLSDALVHIWYVSALSLIHSHHLEKSLTYESDSNSIGT